MKLGITVDEGVNLLDVAGSYEPTAEGCGRARSLSPDDRSAAASLSRAGLSE